VRLMAGRLNLRARLPKSGLGWVFAVTTVLSWAVILGMIGFVLAPTMGDRTTVGSHDWDQMESHRYLVDKTILVYHQFPFWNPYACGGHPNWGGFESGTTVVSPWLPFYLAMTLPHAMRVEVWGARCSRRWARGSSRRASRGAPPCARSSSSPSR